MCMPPKKLMIRRSMALREAERALAKTSRRNRLTNGMDGLALREPACEFTAVDQSSTRTNLQDLQEDMTADIGKIESVIQTLRFDETELNVEKQLNVENDETECTDLPKHTHRSKSPVLTRSYTVKKHRAVKDNEPLPLFMKLPVKKRPINYHELLEGEEFVRRYPKLSKSQQ